DRRRLDALARLVNVVEPAGWSEHLAFVRGGGHEIGHLAAPPRHAGSAEAVARNVSAAQAAVGSAPCMENVATLIAPPGSTEDEVTWLCRVLAATDAGLLLDL